MPSPKADWDNAHVGVQGPPIATATTMNDSVPAADSPFRPLVPEDFRRRGNGRSNSSGDWTALTGRPSASSPRTNPAAATAASPRQKPGSGPGRAQEKNNEPAAAAGLHNSTKEDQTTPRASSFSEAAAAAQQRQKNQQTQSRAVGTSVTTRSAKTNKEMEDKTRDVKQSPTLATKPESPSSVQSIALRDEAERDWQAYWQRQRAQIATHGRRAPPETVQAALRSASKPPSWSLSTDGQRGGGDTQHQPLSSTSAGSQRQQMQRQKPQLKRHSSDNLTGKACRGLFDDQRYDHKRKPVSADVMQEALLGMMNIVETGPKSPQEPLSLGKGLFVDSSERLKLPLTHDSSISGADDAASSSVNGSSIELLEESRPVARGNGKGLSGRRMFRSRSVYVGVGDGSSSNGSSSSASAGTLLPRPEMRNDLTSEERREQLRRAQKLASLLGGEVLASSDGEDAGREAVRHKRSSPRIPGLPRRQSDPFDVLMHRSVMASSPSSRESRHSIHASKAGPREDETAPGPATSTLRARRSRSALGLVGRERSSSTSSPLAPTQPPLDIHPKAAAILGLPHSKGLFAFRPSVTTPPASTNEDDDNEIHAKGQNSATSDSVASWVTSQLDQDHEADQDKDDVEATTLPSSRDSIEMLESDDDAVAEEQEEQGLSLRQGSRVFGEAGQRKTFDPTLLTSSSPAWIREERRKRVTKITRWLGDVVPAHLVTHSSEPQRTPPPAYFFDEMPPSALVDFASGTPLISRSSSSSSSVQKNNHDATESSSPIRPIAKAKAAVNAKLSKSRNGPRAPLLLDTSHKNLSSPQFANVPKSAPPTVDDAHRLTAKEHSDQVRRASKLTSLFGEVPPQPLFAPTQSTEAGKLSTLGITSKHHRSTPSLVRPPFDGAPSLDQMRPAGSHRPRSTSPMSQDGRATTGYSRLGERPKSASDSLQPPPADDGLLSSEHYRYSIDSLEYLFQNDSSLLDNLASALNVDDELLGSKGPSRTKAEAWSIAQARNSSEGRSSGHGHASLRGGDKSLGTTPAVEQDVFVTPKEYDAGEEEKKLAETKETIVPLVDEQASKFQEVTHDSRVADVVPSTASVNTSPATSTKAKKKEHDARVRRHQKLERWFGQAPPPAPHARTIGPASACRYFDAASPTSASSTVALAGSSPMTKRLVTDEVHVISSPTRQHHNPSLFSAFRDDDGMGDYFSGATAEQLYNYSAPPSASLAQELDKVEVGRSGGNHARARPTSLAVSSPTPSSPSPSSPSLFWQKTKEVAQQAFMHTTRSGGATASSSAAASTSKKPSSPGSDLRRASVNGVTMTTSTVTVTSPVTKDPMSTSASSHRDMHSAAKVPDAGSATTDKVEELQDDSIEKLLSSLEEEVRDDRKLSAAEKQEYERRLARLKMQQRRKRESVTAAAGAAS